MQTLFHEYGHALHTILARTKYHHLSGSRGQVFIILYVFLDGFC